MGRPADYYIEYVDKARYDAEVKRQGCPCNTDPSTYHMLKEARTLKEAQRLAKRFGGLIRRRVNILDITPLGDPPGLLWHWDQDWDWIDESEYSHPDETLHVHEGRRT